MEVWKVMYMLEVKDRERAISAAVDFAKEMPQDDRMPLVVKALANYIEKSPVGNRSILKEVDDFLARREPRIALQRILEHMVEIGTSNEQAVRKYTTGEVARFFGVSIQTIHNWIDQGRFKGLPQRSRRKQYRIPETSVYASPFGETILVAEAAEMYAQQQKRLRLDKPMTDEEELAILRKEAAYFEQKYGGSYEETLGRRANLTPEEERDVEEWLSLIRSIERRMERF